ncbi:hypothetical protein V8E36_000281 [Tilletia maclaganii]
MDDAPFPLAPPLSPEDFDAPLFESFDAQVAGHPSTVFRTRGGQVIVKRSLPEEIRFYYEHFNPGVDGPQDPSTIAKKKLALLTPRCHGAVQLSEPADIKAEKGRIKMAEGIVSTGPPLPKLIDLTPAITLQSGGASITRANALVLENILHGFIAPNVLDIKLGTQLWDENATAEKRERMIQAAQTCTSGEFGVRLTGWQTWDEARQKPFNVSKLFGKNILTRPELELGARIFFCSPRHADDTDRYNRVLEKDPKDTPVIATSLPTLPRHLIHQLITIGLLPQLRDIHTLVKGVEWRVRGSSVLLVYEGSAAALEQKLRDPMLDPTSYCKARLIDFAHASFVPGHGPDGGYILGLQTAMSLLEHVASETAPSSRVVSTVT